MQQVCFTLCLCLIHLTRPVLEMSIVGLSCVVVNVSNDWPAAMT